MAASEILGPRWVIGIGGLEVVRAEAGVIVTHALGSCLGVTVFDPTARIAGMLHAQMPTSLKSPDLARSDPARFVDLGMDLMLRRCQELGGDRRRLRLAVAGAANMSGSTSPLFDIGQQNLTALRKVLWRVGLLIAAEDTGGAHPRTMYIDVASGRTTVQTGAARKDL